MLVLLFGTPSHAFYQANPARIFANFRTCSTGLNESVRAEFGHPLVLNRNAPASQPTPTAFSL